MAPAQKSTANKNNLIAKNTLFLYIRMAILMLVTLYSSRVLLRVLGVDDFGIYNVVGGFVAMLAFFTSSLSNVTQRYLNIGIGQNDIELTKHYFEQSLTINIAFSFFYIIDC